MEAKTWALGEILKPERRYIIPTFQRSYEWTRKNQWELLFADLLSTADRLYRHRQSAKLNESKANEASIAPHFLGAIVCDSLPFPAGGVALRSIIDGQQRLTTVQLLLRGLLDVVREADSDGDLKGKAKSLAKMLNNDEDSGASPEDAYKLWPRRDDRALWPAAISDAVPAYNKNDHLYLQARRYFAEAMRGYLVKKPETERLDRLRSVVDAIDTLFKLVVIDLDQNDDAQVIFEVLNGRQQPLSASDLVKNLIFLRAEFAKADHLDNMYDLYWSQFDEEWWKKEVGVGHAARGRRDVLLSVWLTAKTSTDVSVGNLYGEVRSYLDREKPKTEDLLTELKAFAKSYQEVYAKLKVDDNDIKQAYSHLIELGNLTAVPLLVWLRTVPPEKLGVDHHRKAVQAIESFTVRRMIAGSGWGTRNYGQIFVKALSDAKAANSDGVLVAIVSALRDAGWPAEAELQTAMSANNFYRQNRNRQKLVLSAIDRRLRADDPKQASANVDYSKLQIEHILPNAWEAHWPIDESLKEVERLNVKDARNLAKNRIGNLTLVTQNFNGSVSNLGWSHKKPEFANQSSLVLNMEIAQADSWDESQIADRCSTLAEIAAKIWPSHELFTPSTKGA